MQHFLIGCAIGAVIAVCVAAPLLAPWRFRIRYLVNAPMADPLLGLTLTPRLEMRAVTLAAVAADRGHVELVVEEICPGRESRRSTLTRDACMPSVVAALDEWSALYTPLLMIVDEDEGVHLYGPEGAVTKFSLARARVR